MKEIIRIIIQYKVCCCDNNLITEKPSVNIYANISIVHNYEIKIQSNSDIKPKSYQQPIEIYRRYTEEVKVKSLLPITLQDVKKSLICLYLTTWFMV